jgi:hypothetical protein
MKPRHAFTATSRAGNRVSDRDAQTSASSASNLASRSYERSISAMDV